MLKHILFSRISLFHEAFRTLNQSEGPDRIQHPIYTEDAFARNNNVRVTLIETAGHDLFRTIARIYILDKGSVFRIYDHCVSPRYESLVVDFLNENNCAVVEFGLHAVAGDSEGKFRTGTGTEHRLAVTVDHTPCAEGRNRSGKSRYRHQRNAVGISTRYGRQTFRAVAEHIPFPCEQPAEADSRESGPYLVCHITGNAMFAVLDVIQCNNTSKTSIILLKNLVM